MFGIFTGSIANAAMVVAGTALGLIFKGERLKNIGERIFQVFALFVIVMGVSGASDLSRPLLILGCLIVGVALGELIDLDDKFIRLGEFFKKRFAKEGDTGFAEGFVSASLLFCIGSMTFMGAFEGALSNTHTIYYTKGVIDMMSAITFAMGYGIGTGFSAIIVLAYQGLLTGLIALGAAALSAVFTEEMIALSSTVGSLFLVAIGLNMLGLTKIKVANFIPAMFMPFIYQAVLLIVK